MQQSGSSTSQPPKTDPPRLFCTLCLPWPPAVKVHRNFKEALTIKTPFAAEAIYGGQLLGVRGQDFVCFYDWATGKVRSSCFLPPWVWVRSQAGRGWLAGWWA